MNIYTNYECEHCPNQRLVIVDGTTFIQYNEFQCFECPKCHSKHYQCKECISMLFTTKKQINNHVSYHKRKRSDEIDKDEDGFQTENDFVNENRYSTQDSVGVEGSLVDSNYTHHRTIAEDSCDMKPSSSANKMQYTSQASNEFFNHNGDCDIGVQNLIVKSQQLSELGDNSISREDIQLHLCYSRLSYNLGPSDRQLLCKLTQSIITHVTRSVHHQSQKNEQKYTSGDKVDVYQQTTIPTTLMDIRQQYLEGKNAIVTNLPKPFIHTTATNHAYVRIKDVIQHFFAYGSSPEFLSKFSNESNTLVSYPSECQQVKNIYEHMNNKDNDIDGVSEILITEWHDDFEPNTQSKQNRGSVWILSVTILSTRDIKNSQHYTFPIAIGEKNSSHEDVLSIFYDDIQKSVDEPISVYDHTTKIYRKIRLVKLLSIADSPERRSSNFIKLGTGTHATRWGYSLNVNAKRSSLVTCNTCLQLMISRGQIRKENDCEKCTNFTFNVKNTVTKDYPTNLLEDPDVLEISTKQLTYEDLITCIELTFNNVKSQFWNKKTGKEYLSSFGLNDKIIKNVVKAAENNTILGSTLPSKWKFNKGPLMLAHIDPLMHLLFYGVGSSTIEELKHFLVMRERHSQFKRIADVLITKVSSLKLSWCKLLLYKEGTFGGWIAENWIAFMRVTNWVTARVDSIAENVNYQEPHEPMEKWKKDQLKNWCKWHGVAAGARNKKELFIYVCELINNKDESLEVIKNPGGEVRNVTNCLRTMSRMISILMQTEMNEDLISESDLSIRIYLRMVEELNNALRNRNDKPIWISRSNYLSLLNLPEQMRFFGPLRLYWEGGWKGEGIIQEIKEIIRDGLKKIGLQIQ